MAVQATCIYSAESPVCDHDFDPTVGEGDHVLPAKLGEFEGDKRFRGACPRCNNLFGQNEQQIVQSGLEGYLRYHAQPRSKRINRSGLKPMRGAKGAAAPQHTVTMDGEAIAVRPFIESPEDVYPFDHVRVTDESGKEFTLELHPETTANHIRAKFSKLGIQKAKRIFVHCDDKYWEHYIAIVKEVCGESSVQELGTIEPGKQRIKGRAKFTVTTAYFQAIAKIAFHYYLIHGNRGYRGDEAIFKAIRQFIVTGGDIDAVFLKKDRFYMPLGPAYGASPANWCHLLLADESGPELVSRVQLFLGPGCVPHAHSVLLGNVNERSQRPRVFGHVYPFDAADDQMRYCGKVQAIPGEAFSELTVPPARG